MFVNKKLQINSKYFYKILELLNDSRLIGGCVRDALIGIANSDIDIATKMLPIEVINKLTENGIKVVPTGIQFGTVTAFLDNEKFEITTLRKDINCFGRYANVQFTNNFEEDAGRRDFTINALSYCPIEEKLYDYFNGLQDIEQKRVVFIGNAEERIKEDYLRILRFFRFSGNYAKQIDQPSLAACIKLKGEIKSLTRERIKLEMDKIIITKNAPDILQIMFDNQILQIIFPIKNYNSSSFQEAISFNIVSYLFLYSLLFYAATEITVKSLLSLKFSKQESSKIVDIINFLNQPLLPLKECWLEKSDYLGYIALAVALNKISNTAAQNFISIYKTRTRPTFPLTGNDLLRTGEKDKEIGRKLKLLKNIWIESDFKISKEELLTLVGKT